MTIYICKMCGRGVRCDEKPNYCYFDRMDLIENLSDEDAERINIVVSEKDAEFVPEFPGDVRYHPFTGKEILMEGKTLYDFQREIIRKL